MKDSKPDWPERREAADEPRSIVHTIAQVTEIGLTLGVMGGFVLAVGAHGTGWGTVGVVVLALCAMPWLFGSERR